jgi:hypothetical protein
MRFLCLLRCGCDAGLMTASFVVLGDALVGGEGSREHVSIENLCWGPCLLAAPHSCQALLRQRWAWKPGSSSHLPPSAKHVVPPLLTACRGAAW